VKTKIFSIISLLLSLPSLGSASKSCDYRIISFRENSIRHYGILVAPFSEIPSSAIRLNQIANIDSKTPADTLLSSETQDKLAKLACEISSQPSRFEKFRASFERAAIESPIPQPRQIVAVGMNYADHNEEVGIEDVIVFPKNLSVSGPYDSIPRPPGALLDWEVELAIVVRKKITSETKLTVDNSNQYLAGFLIANDVTDRVPIILDKEHGFSQGKTLPGFLPLGPYLAPIDGFAKKFQLNPGLEMSLLVNGETRQNANTKQMANSIPLIIEKILREKNEMWTDASQKRAKLLPLSELLPGDLIITGTPGGTAIKAPNLRKKIGLGLKSLVRAQDPYWVFVNEQYCSGIYLRDSDTVSARIESLGAQENLVVENQETFEPKVACSSKADIRRGLGI
jgi:2-keto-4-pentenoate hydratase/2-oxohepta-3-ene-1,7-dioic acid hydratase in catechol pathway